MSTQIKLAIADDNSFLISAVREKLSFFDDIAIRLTAGNGELLHRQLQKDPAIDVILMDIEMPVMNGIEATGKIKQEFPEIRIIMLTVFDNDEHIFNAIKAGADGYLLKEVNPQDLYNGIKHILEGGAVMTPSIAMRTLNFLRNPAGIENAGPVEEVELSDREIDVLEQLSRGLSYTLIAEKLFISPFTVRKHIENIYKKLQVHSKLEAIQKAKRNNLI